MPPCCLQDVDAVALFVRLEDLVYGHPEVRAQAPAAGTARGIKEAKESLSKTFRTGRQSMVQPQQGL